MAECVHCSKEGEIAGLKSDIKAIFKRIDEQIKLVEAVHDLAAEMRVMNVRLQTIEDGQKQMKEDMDEMKAVPAKRWNHVVQTVIGVVLAAVVTWLLTRAGV